MSLEFPSPSVPILSVAIGQICQQMSSENEIGKSDLHMHKSDLVTCNNKESRYCEHILSMYSHKKIKDNQFLLNSKGYQELTIENDSNEEMFTLTKLCKLV